MLFMYIVYMNADETCMDFGQYNAQRARRSVACIHAYVHTCTHTCILFLHTCVYACPHSSISYIHAYVHTHTHTSISCIHAYAPTYIQYHEYMNVYILTCTYTYTNAPPICRRLSFKTKCKLLNSVVNKSVIIFRRWFSHTRIYIYI